MNEAIYALHMFYIIHNYGMKALENYFTTIVIA